MFQARPVGLEARGAWCRDQTCPPEASGAGPRVPGSVCGPHSGPRRIRERASLLPGPRDLECGAHALATWHHHSSGIPLCAPFLSPLCREGMMSPVPVMASPLPQVPLALRWRLVEAGACSEAGVQALCLVKYACPCRLVTSRGRGAGGQPPAVKRAVPRTPGPGLSQPRGPRSLDATHPGTGQGGQ